MITCLLTKQELIEQCDKIILGVPKRLLCSMDRLLNFIIASFVLQLFICKKSTFSILTITAACISHPAMAIAKPDKLIFIKNSAKFVTEVSF